MSKTFVEEMIEAGKGSFLLLIGRRNAGEYFDLGLRGLAGSFIALLLATTFTAYLPGIMGQNIGATGEVITAPAASQALFMSLILFGMQTGFGALALRQFGRIDGLMPYLVADNWATFFAAILFASLLAFNVNSDLVILSMGAIVLVSEINISRLIVTLKPIQIAMFIVAQLVGALIGLMILGSLFPGEITG